MRSLIYIAAALACLSAAAVSSLDSAELVVTKSNCVVAVGKCVELRGPVNIINSFDAPPAPEPSPEPSPQPTQQPG